MAATNLVKIPSFVCFSNRTPIQFFPTGQESENSGSWPPLMGKGVKADKNYYVRGQKPAPSGVHNSRYISWWDKKMTFNLYDSGYSSVDCSQMLFARQQCSQTIHRFRSEYNKYFLVFHECTNPYRYMVRCSKLIKYDIITCLFAYQNVYHEPNPLSSVQPLDFRLSGSIRVEVDGPTESGRSRFTST